MSFVFFTVWVFGVLVCLGLMLGFPDKLRFWDVAKPQSEYETRFIQSNLEILKNYQLSLSVGDRRGVLSPFTQAAYLVLIGGAVLIAFNLSFSFSAWAIHFFIEVPGSKFVVKPYAGDLTNMFVFLVSVGIVQFFLRSKAGANSTESKVFLFEPVGDFRNDKDKFLSVAQKIREDVSHELSDLLKSGRLIPDKTYALNDLSNILYKNSHRQSKGTAVASLILILLIHVMQAFSFVSVTEDRFIYSPQFSFEIIQSEFNSSVRVEPCLPLNRYDGAKYVWMTIDDGFEFSVQDTQTEGLYNFIKSQEISDVSRRC